MSEVVNPNKDDLSTKPRSIPTVYYVFFSLCAVILLFAGFVVYSIATRSIKREIARDISISSEWSEIVPNPSLKARNRKQYVSLQIEGFRDIVDNDWSKVVLSDGVIASPEVQITDEHGKTYKLKSRMISDAGLGFSKDYDYSIDSHFPKDRVYTKVRIRSDKPFHISKLTWYCYNPK